MGIQSGPISLWFDDDQFYPLEDMCWMYQYFCWSTWVMIHFCEFSEGADIWMTFYLWKIVLWRDNSLFSHNVAIKSSCYFIVDFTSKTVLFHVWDLWGPWYLIGYGLILLTSFLMDLLTFIWYILVVNWISKILVNNGLNYGMGCWHVHICYF